MFMRRRTLIGLIGLAPLAGPLSAQERRSRRLIARLSTGTAESTAPFNEAFLQGMHELHLLEDQDFDIVYRFAEGYRDRLSHLGHDILNLKPTVIIPSASAETVVMASLTTEIPIVTPALADPKDLGLIVSEVHPGRNVTGIQPYVPGLPSKQFELTRDLIGASLRKVGVLSDLGDPKALPQWRELSAAGQSSGTEVIRAEAKNPEEIKGALDILHSNRVDAVVILQTSMLFNARKQIAAIANSMKLPTICGYREHVVSGSLISYGVDLRSCFRMAAGYVKKIFDGEKAGDLPIQFPNSLYLTINMDTAKYLGVSVSSDLLARADEVID